MEWWGWRLAALTDGMPGITPPPRVWTGIRARLGLSEPAGAKDGAPWWASLPLWRGLAFAGFAQPLLQRDMMRVCSACQQKARCDRDLETGTSAQHYEEYCRNAPSIDSPMKSVACGLGVADPSHSASAVA